VDQELQDYRRRLAQGDGDPEEYLRLCSRAGILVGENLRGYHRKMAENHILNCGSVSCTQIGSDNKAPVVEALRVLSDVGLANRCVIITPYSCMPAWAKALGNDLDVSLLRGRSREKRKVLAGKGQVFITSYASMVAKSLGSAVCAQKWDVVVADEIRFIKNPNAQRSKYCYELADNTKRRIGLSSCGSGLLALREIWGVCRFIEPELLGTKYDFMARYFEPAKYGWEPKTGAARKMLRIVRQVPGLSLAELRPGWWNSRTRIATPEHANG
jgi:hypothetical protein